MATAPRRSARRDLPDPARPGLVPHHPFLASTAGGGRRSRADHPHPSPGLTGRHNPCRAASQGKPRRPGGNGTDRRRGPRPLLVPSSVPSSSESSEADHMRCQYRSVSAQTIEHSPGQAEDIVRQSTSASACCHRQHLQLAFPPDRPQRHRAPAASIGSHGRSKDYAAQQRRICSEYLLWYLLCAGGGSFI